MNRLGIPLVPAKEMAYVLLSLNGIEWMYGYEKGPSYPIGIGQL